jgi:flagellar protein FlaJ
MSTPGGIQTPMGEGQTPLPEYEVSQYFPRSREMTDDEMGALREQYGSIRAYFKAHPGRYRETQRWLNQARIGTTYDVYLTRSVHLALLAGGAGALVGGVVAWLLADAGVLAALDSPLTIGGSVGSFLAANRVLFAALLLTLVVGGTTAGSTWLFRYYYPQNLVANRERAINVMLPHALTYMYALSHGGMNLLAVFESLAGSEDTYGEVALEFDMVARDMQLFGNDMVTALRNARNLTPSDELEQFLDDLIGLLDSGGDVTAFLEDQADNYTEAAKEEQEGFLETLSVLSEVFIVGFVAAPLFLVVTLMVISFLGGSTLLQMAALIYVGLPLGMLAFLLLIDLLSAPYVQPDDVQLEERRERPIDTSDVADDERYLAYQRGKRSEQLVAFARDPLAALRRSPVLTLVFTGPASVAFVLGMVLRGTVTPSVDALLVDPVTVTTLLFVLPALIVAMPLSYYHERKRRRENLLAARFPDTLNVLSSANHMGIPLVDALDMVARWSKGSLADEIRVVRNDVRWNHDLTDALLGLGNRLNVPHISRTIKLVAEGGRSSGDMSRILAIAAEDTRTRHRIERARHRAMSSYLAIVMIGFLVYLLVIVLIDASFLGAIAEATATAPEDTPTGAGVVGFTNVPLDTYRALFFHSVIVMAAGAGLLAGKLGSNDTLSGLKYSIGLTMVALATFVLV